MNSRVKKNIDCIILSAAFILGCFFISGCENDEAKIKMWTEKKAIGEDAKSVTSYFSQMGIMKAKLTAPVLLRFQTDTIYTEFPKSLHVDFYDTNTKMESQLDALYGKYFENLNKVFLRDSVVVMNIKGDTLRCPELWWDQQTKTFFTDKIVRIHTKDKHIYGGRGLEADQAFSWYIIKEPTGTILVSDSLQ
jgi:LPS export ABC transporter protein LptC